MQSSANPLTSPSFEDAEERRPLPRRANYQPTFAGPLPPPLLEPSSEEGVLPGDRVQSLVERPWKTRPLNVGDQGLVLELFSDGKVRVRFDGNPPMSGSLRFTSIQKLATEPPACTLMPG